MAKYLTKYTTKAQYQDDVISGVLDYPNVSYIVSDDEVVYSLSGLDWDTNEAYLMLTTGEYVPFPKTGRNYFASSGTSQISAYSATTKAVILGTVITNMGVVGQNFSTGFNSLTDVYVLGNLTNISPNYWQGTYSREVNMHIVVSDVPASFGKGNWYNNPVFVPCDFVDNWKAKSTSSNSLNVYGNNTAVNQICKVTYADGEVFTFGWCGVDKFNANYFDASFIPFPQSKDNIREIELTHNAVSSNAGSVSSLPHSTQKLIIPNTLVSGMPNTSNMSGLTTVIFEEGFSQDSLDQNAFWQCTNLSSITIPDSVTNIGKGFYRCTSLPVDFKMPSGLTRADNECFYGCNQFPVIDNVRYVDTLVIGFSGSPQNITFREGTRVESCPLPNSVKTVTFPASIAGMYGFYGRTGLTSVTVMATTPPVLLGYAPFFNTTFTLYVPAEAVDTYKTADDWSTIAERIMPITE